MTVDRDEEQKQAVAAEAEAFFAEKAKEFLGTQVVAKSSSVPEVEVKVEPDKKGVKAMVYLKWTF